MNEKVATCNTHGVTKLSINTKTLPTKLTKALYAVIAAMMNAHGRLLLTSWLVIVNYSRKNSTLCKV